MSVTVDANGMVYASNEADPAHSAARLLVEELATGPGLVYLFWPTIMGYLRIVTHPALLPAPLAFAEAAANVSALLDRPHVRAPGEEEGFWGLYRTIAPEHQRGNDVPDSHVVTLMRQHGVTTIYTRDRDFQRYEGIEARDPFS